MREAGKIKKKGMIPASMSCQNAPNAGSLLKPQVSFQPRMNTDKRAWVAYAYWGNLDWKPGKPGQTGPYKKVYGKRFGASGSGKVFNCSLWVGPKGSLGRMKKVGSWAMSGTAVLGRR